VFFVNADFFVERAGNAGATGGTSTNGAGYLETK
jgi:hypothetical protein